MCGIAGVVAPSQRIAETLDAMWPGIASRGPDGRGSHIEAGVGLLHSRLAIIDLVTGDQPIFNEDRTVACVFNGEIYNHLALRDELVARGHIFASRSDTEVLVHAYEEYGDAFVDRLRGMYAFAILDRGRRRVLVARDRLGIKPLIVARHAGGWLFASAIASLVDAGVNRAIDSHALAQYLRYYKVPEPATIYRDVRTVPPGHGLIIDVDGATATTQRLRRPVRFQPASDLRDAEERARSSFTESVRSHLIADVEVGAFLSGGIDSTLVIAEAQRLHASPLRTFSFAFAGHASYDETHFAEAVARGIGTRHETIEVTIEPRDLVRLALSATHQPFAVASFLPALLLSRAAAKHVKVVLTGDGGDEIACGYPWHAWAERTPSIPLPGAPYVAHLAANAASGIRPLRRALKFASGMFASGGARVEHWRYDVSTADACDLLRSDLRANAPSSPFVEGWNHTLRGGDAARLTDVDVLLRDEMLPKLDRAGMAWGLEGRVPLLDDDFVDAMMTIPCARQLDDPRGKFLLRRWAKALCPELDVLRPKHGFDVPILSWLQGSLRDDLQRLVLSPQRESLFHYEAAQRMWRRAIDGTPGAAHAVYAILLASLWYEQSAK
jgi:asparagine synthase (glutamine-hydrolysing)